MTYQDTLERYGRCSNPDHARDHELVAACDEPVATAEHCRRLRREALEAAGRIGR